MALSSWINSRICVEKSAPMTSLVPFDVTLTSWRNAFPSESECTNDVIYVTAATLLAIDGTNALLFELGNWRQTVPKTINFTVIVGRIEIFSSFWACNKLFVQENEIKNEMSVDL